MELHKELLLGNLPTTTNAVGFLSLYMQGPAPTNAEELKAAINIYDYLDIYNKSVGIALYNVTSASYGQVVGANLTQLASRVAFKKGPFDFATPSTALPAGVSKASLPDRIFACIPSAPYDRFDTKDLGMVSLYVANMAPWLSSEASSSVPLPLYPGKASSHPHLGSSTCQEFEWDTPRTLTGVLRSSGYGVSGSGYQTLVVDAWNGSSWDTVLPLNQKSYAAYALTYHAFASPVTTNRLRLRWASTYGSDRNFTFPHGVIPVEQTATRPDPVSVPDIQWAVLIPMFGKLLPVAAVDTVRFNKVNAPVPLYSCRVGGPGDGPECDIILSKNTQLSSSDMPGMTGVRFNGANITE